MIFANNSTNIDEIYVNTEGDRKRIIRKGKHGNVVIYLFISIIIEHCWMPALWFSGKALAR